MFTYFMIMNDFGMPFTTLVSLNNQRGFYPNDADVYSPFEPNLGNSNFGNVDMEDRLQWSSTKDNEIDIRLFYWFNQVGDWSQCRWDPQDSSINKFWRISPITDTQICYTAESLFYA